MLVGGSSFRLIWRCCPELNSITFPDLATAKRIDAEKPLSDTKTRKTKIRYLITW
jgi:hypothetical protein